MNNKVPPNPGNLTMFLDAVLSSQTGWQLAVEPSVQAMVDPATLALLAKAHGARLAVIDATDEQADRPRTNVIGNGHARSGFLHGALVVCGVEFLKKPTSLRQLPNHAALMVLDCDDLSATDSQPLRDAGFSQVDAISVPHGTSFWLRTGVVRHFSPSVISGAFGSCVNNKGGMATTQYFRVVSEILCQAPCDILIFGAGADTALYTQANSGGRTVVVEHRASWREKVAGLPCEVIPVEYVTSIANGLQAEVRLPTGFPL